MSETNKDKQWIDKLSQWENALRTYEPSQFRNTVDYWLDSTFDLLPAETKELFFAQIDTWLFHLHGFIQQSSFQQQAEVRIIKMAQTFQEDIESIEDIQHLSLNQKAFIADQQIAKQKLYSIVQGGLTGSGKLSALSVDIPAFAALNIRTTQLIALSYGYRASTPYEMVKALQLFYGATVPKQYQYQRWEILRADLERDPDLYFDTLSEKDRPTIWLQQPLLHIAKLIFVIMAGKRKINGIPLLGMLAATGTNFYWTKEVAQFAHHYYMMRHLVGKGDLEKNGQ